MNESILASKSGYLFGGVSGFVPNPSQLKQNGSKNHSRAALLEQKLSPNQQRGLIESLEVKEKTKRVLKYKERKAKGTRGLDDDTEFLCLN